MSVKKTIMKKTAKKAVVKKAVKKAPARKNPAKKATAKQAAPSTEAVAKAAYILYRHRLDLGLPGDHASDWLAAERSFTKG